MFVKDVQRAEHLTQGAGVETTPCFNKLVECRGFGEWQSHIALVLPTNVEQRIGNLSERGDFTDSIPNLNATRRHSYLKSIPRILYER